MSRAILVFVVTGHPLADGTNRCFQLPGLQAARDVPRSTFEAHRLLNIAQSPMSKQTSGRDARVGILPDTPRERNVKMFDGFMKSPLWANLYRQELAKESGKPIIQMLMDENYREPPDAKLKPVVVPGQVTLPIELSVKSQSD
jgi:hypothetical protein